MAPGPADRLPFGDGEFDAVVCQQGLQFFPDAAAALTEAARVSRPGARVAVTVWSPLERSPYFEAQFLAIRQIAGAQAVTSFEGAFGSRQIGSPGPSRRLVSGTCASTR